MPTLCADLGLWNAAGGQHLRLSRHGPEKSDAGGRPGGAAERPVAAQDGRRSSGDCARLWKATQEALPSRSRGEEVAPGRGAYAPCVEALQRRHTLAPALSAGHAEAEFVELERLRLFFWGWRDGFVSGTLDDEVFLV